MNDTKKAIDPLPKEFASYQEAAEFWETHDTTDYPDAFRTVEMEGELRQRHYEVEIEPDLVRLLQHAAQAQGCTVSQIVSSILRRQLIPAEASG